MPSIGTQNLPKTTQIAQNSSFSEKFSKVAFLASNDYEIGNFEGLTWIRFIASNNSKAEKP